MDSLLFVRTLSTPWINISENEAEFQDRSIRVSVPVTQHASKKSFPITNVIVAV
jgi:hypothetical protein